MSESGLQPPREIVHAERHIAEARREWESGHLHMAAMHLREGITDATWSLYQLWAIAEETANG